MLWQICLHSECIAARHSLACCPHTHQSTWTGQRSTKPSLLLATATSQQPLFAFALNLSACPALHLPVHCICNTSSRAKADANQRRTNVEPLCCPGGRGVQHSNHAVVVYGGRFHHALRVAGHHKERAVLAPVVAKLHGQPSIRMYSHTSKQPQCRQLSHTISHKTDVA